MGLTAISFIVVMSVLVFVHELGHFLVAKRSKIVVEEFGMGYPPRVLKLGERDGTVYSINAIPFGGFCRMRGEDNPSLAGSFAAAPKSARAATLVAGPAMNFVLAIVLFSVAVMATGVADTSRPGPVVAQVSAGSPAATAALEVGDRIVAANGTPIANLKDLQANTAEFAGQAVTYDVVRVDPATGASRTIRVTMTPRSTPPSGEGPLGIAITTAVRQARAWEALWSGVRSTWDVIELTFSVPMMLIRQGRPINDLGVMGPLGIGVTTGEVVRSALDVKSFVPVLTFVALLSAALGITNLLPIPALDGGRLLFIFVEAIRRKRVAPAQEGLVHLVGFGLLLLLVGVITAREVVQLATGQFPSLGLP